MLGGTIELGIAGPVSHRIFRIELRDAEYLQFTHSGRIPKEDNICSAPSNQVFVAWCGEPNRTSSLKWGKGLDVSDGDQVARQPYLILRTNPRPEHAWRTQISGSTN